MQTFIQKYNKVITGVLSGFDRLVFRGTLRQIVYTENIGRSNFPGPGKNRIFYIFSNNFVAS